MAGIKLRISEKCNYGRKYFRNSVAVIDSSLTCVLSSKGKRVEEQSKAEQSRVQSVGRFEGVGPPRHLFCGSVSSILIKSVANRGDDALPAQDERVPTPARATDIAPSVLAIFAITIYMLLIDAGIDL